MNQPITEKSSKVTLAEKIRLDERQREKEDEKKFKSILVTFIYSFGIGGFLGMYGATSYVENQAFNNCLNTKQTLLGKKYVYCEVPDNPDEFWSKLLKNRKPPNSNTKEKQIEIITDNRE